MGKEDSLEIKVGKMRLGEIILEMHQMYHLDDNVILSENDLEYMDQESQENWRDYQILLKELNTREKAYLSRSPPGRLMTF